MPRHSPGLIATGSVGLLLALAFATSALAHAAYESSDPANGESVSSPPSRVTAEFTEPVISQSYLSVYDPCGEQVDNGDSLVAADRITVTMSADKQGTYTVTFDVVSSVDGHPTNGKFTFSSTGGELCPGAEEPKDEEEASEDDSSGSGGADDAGQTGEEKAEDGAAPTKDRVKGTRQTRPRAEVRERQTGGRRAGTMRAQRETAEIELAQENVPSSTETGIWAGIPVIPFILALSIAALIGAAGGSIYANIMGPNR